MNLENMTYKEVREKEIEYIKNVIMQLAHRLEYDEWFGGWCLGEEPLVDYFYNNETTYLNPKELEGYMEEIIEDEIGLKR